MQFAVPESSNSLDLTSNSQSAVFSDEHQSSVAQEFMRNHFEPGDAGEGPWAMNEVQCPLPQLSRQQLSSTLPNTKTKKGSTLRKRISKFFTGPHNASLEPRRVVNDIPPPADAPRYAFFTVPDDTHRSKPLECQPPDASRLPTIPSMFNSSTFNDRSNFDSHLSVGSDDKARNLDAPTGHHRFNIRRRLFARPGPSAAPPLGRKWSQLPETDETTHSGYSTRWSSSADLRETSLRPSDVRFPRSRRNLTLQDLYTQEQLPQQLGEERLHNTTSYAGEDDRPHWHWPARASDLLKDIPASNVGARQLALLNPGHRGGIIVRSGSTPPARSISQMTAMDTENVSADWQLQHSSSGSVADANAQFGFRNIIGDADASAKHPDFSFSNTIDISPQFHESALSCRAGSESSSYGSACGLDAAVKAARERTPATSSTLPRATRSTSLPLIPTGSDIVRAAAADPKVDETPMAFRAYFDDDGYTSAGERSREQKQQEKRKMVSTRWAPTPLPHVARDKKGDQKQERKNNGRFELTYESDSADSFQGGIAQDLIATPADATGGDTPRLLELVRTLEDQRRGLLQQKQELLAVVYHAKGLLEGAEKAYDAAEEKAGSRIGGLERDCAKLRGENDRLKRTLNSEGDETAGRKKGANENAGSWEVQKAR